VFHNAHFDIPFIERDVGVKLSPSRVRDTYIMQRILHPDETAALKPLTAKLVDSRAAAMQSQLDVAMRTNGWTWATVPQTFTLWWAYGALDTVLTARLYQILSQEAISSDAEELELATIFLTLQLERRGVQLSGERVRAWQLALSQALAVLQRRCVTEFKVDPGSNAQVGEALLHEGVALVTHTPGGNISVSKSALTEVSHPLAELVLYHRHLTKLLSTYFDNFSSLADERLKLHAHINTLAAKTGRMSISDPALQTLPRTSIVRDCVVADNADENLATVDYDQIELRLAAHYSDDAALISAILHSDTDIHTELARQIYSDPTLQHDDARRQVSKAATFAKLYGAGVHTFARTTGISEREAAAAWQRYDTQFPGLRQLTLRVTTAGTQRQVESGKPWVRLPSGRRFYAAPQQAHKLLNYLIQGTAAEVFKRALVRLDAAGLLQYARLPVHDELILSVPRQSPEILSEVARVMQDDTYAVPLTVATTAALESWGDKYPPDSEVTAALAATNVVNPSHTA
jgi:DNA polymerase-1